MVQNMTVRHPATIISAAPETILLLIIKENLSSTAMLQLPMPMTIHPRIWKGGRPGPDFFETFTSDQHMATCTVS